jgi:crotonobetainyl-CoA:carnitine CoA-transferase CaiB-like acyl-CoA transferase
VSEEPTGPDSVGAGGGPLAGLLVADFSRVLAGPYASMLLADMGADVVKVESPGGDDTRTWMPPVRDGVSTYFLGVNRNKRSVALDLKDAGDVDLARELAGRADIFLENFKPGGLARFGLDYDAVSARNPAIVYASISGFGSGGGRSLPGYDLIVQAMSGLMSLTGDADGPPYRAGISVFDVMAGLHATIGVLAALHHRDLTGRGQHVEVSLLSSALSGLVNQSSAVVAGGVVPMRMGNSHPSLFPYDPLPTADKELIITAGNDGQFRRLCEVLGVPELVEDPRFRRNQDRTAHREELRPLLVERLRTRSADEWFRKLIAAGVACGPINTVDGGVAFAEQLGLDPVVRIGPDAVPSVRHPITFSATPARHALPPPELDEHGSAIGAWLADPAQRRPA